MYNVYILYVEKQVEYKGIPAQNGGNRVVLEALGDYEYRLSIHVSTWDAPILRKTTD